MPVNAADRILAYDIGGSHVSVALCLLEPMAVLETVVAPLPDADSSNDFLDLLQELGQMLTRLHRAAGASLAFPAPFSYDTGVSRMRHKLASVYGVDLRTALAERFGWGPGRVCFLNDADAALLGEIKAGAARGVERAVGIMLGTGIGFSYVQGGRLNDTAAGIPPGNEIWDLPFLGGIVEDRLSSRALEHDYEALAGKRQSVAAMVERTATDAAVSTVFDTFGRNLGQVIQEFIAPLHPQVVVVGGGISRSSHLFLPAARNQIASPDIRLVPSVLLDKAPFLGAASYWLTYSRQAGAPSTVPAATHTDAEY